MKTKDILYWIRTFVLSIPFIIPLIFFMHSCVSHTISTYSKHKTPDDFDSYEEYEEYELERQADYEEQMIRF